MSKWVWVVALVASIVAMGCKKEPPRRSSILNMGEGEEVEPEVKTFSPEDHFDLGMVYYGGGKFKEAEAQFLMALAERPDYVDALVGLGYVYHFRAFMEIQSDKARDAIELHERAAAMFRKAIEKNPRKVEAYIGLAMVNYDEYQYFVPRKEEYKIRSINYLKQARTMAPKDPVVQANLGFHEAKYAIADKDYDAAVPLLTRVVECEGIDFMTRVQAHYMLAGALYLVGNKQGAIDHYRRYLELFPGAQDADDVKDTIAEIQRELLRK